MDKRRCPKISGPILQWAEDAIISGKYWPEDIAFIVVENLMARPYDERILVLEKISQGSDEELQDEIVLELIHRNQIDLVVGMFRSGGCKGAASIMDILVSKIYKLDLRYLERRRIK